MTKYQSHKRVTASAISKIERNTPDGQVALYFVDPEQPDVSVPPEWYDKHVTDPNDPGYYVCYEDGYTSWSPTAAFELGYTALHEPRYSISPNAAEKLTNNFTYHRPQGDQPTRYGAIRALARNLAVQLSEDCPESRELSIAMTKLEEAVFWANAAIARNEEAEV